MQEEPGRQLPLVGAIQGGADGVPAGIREERGEKQAWVWTRTASHSHTPIPATAPLLATSSFRSQLRSYLLEALQDHPPRSRLCWVPLCSPSSLSQHCLLYWAMEPLGGGGGVDCVLIGLCVPSSHTMFDTCQYSKVIAFGVLFLRLSILQYPALTKPCLPSVSLLPIKPKVDLITLMLQMKKKHDV